MLAHLQTACLFLQTLQPSGVSEGVAVLLQVVASQNKRLVDSAAASEAVVTEDLAQQEHKQHSLAQRDKQHVHTFHTEPALLLAAGGSMSKEGLVDDLAASEAVMTDALAAAQGSAGKAQGRQRQTLYQI